MTARSRGRSTFQGRAAVRRESLWLFVDGGQFTIGGALGSLLFGTLNAAALALRPFTVVRTRGIFHVASDQAIADEPYGMSLGYAVVSEQAEAIGVTAIPTPETDRGSDLWFVYESNYGRSTVSVGAPTSLQDQGSVIHYDSKAMRKVEDGETLILALETPAFAFGTVCLHAARILIKLH